MPRTPHVFARWASPIACALLVLLVLAGCGGSSSGGGATGGTVDVSAAIQHNLTRLNAFRALEGMLPLTLGDATLMAYALEGTNQLIATNVPHGHFTNPATPCPCTSENQGFAQGFGTTNQNIDVILQGMYDEKFTMVPPPPNHFTNMTSATITVVGIGIVVDGAGKVTITNDFQ